MEPTAARADIPRESPQAQHQRQPFAEIRPLSHGESLGSPKRETENGRCQISLVLPLRIRNSGRTILKPRKLIISRKGFDSGSGRCPSPIFPDGTMFSLPIPSRDREQFADLQHGDVDIASVVTGITNGRMNRRGRVHLDPDLNFDTYRYRKDRPD